MTLTRKLLAPAAIALSGVCSAPASAQLAPPSNTAPPAISGVPQVGSLLTCVAGGWSGVPISYAYQWSRNGSPIGGATAADYSVASGDAGTSLTCTETATNLFGSTPATSAAVAVPAAGGGGGGGGGLLPAPGGPGGTPAKDTTAPAIQNFKASPKRASLPAPRKGRKGRMKTSRKQSFTFQLSEDAAVTITVRYNGKAPKRARLGGTMTAQLKRGQQKLASASSIGYARAGQYTITAQATDAAGNRSTVATTTVRISKPRRR